MKTAAAGFLILIVMMLMLLIAGVASAQQRASKVWTDADLKKPIRAKHHRQLTESEMAGVRARAFVAPPVWPAGPVSVGTTWTPDDDRPDRGRLPVWYGHDISWPQFYASQPIWPSVWYPQPVYIPRDLSWRGGPYIYRQPHQDRRR